MSNWVWLSRVTLLSFVGTAAFAVLLFSARGFNPSASTPSDRIPSTTTSPGKIEEVDLSTFPLPTSMTGRDRSMKFAGNSKVPTRPFDLQQSLTNYSPLFAAPTSLGMVAIGVAEGNYRLLVKDGTLYVQQTPFYFGHTDPGNLSWGDVVSNYGPCSDQGRSKGDIALAERICLERARNGLPTQLFDLNTAGIDPNLDLEAVLNTADLYNQASPIHSRYFPQALAIARNGGLKGIEALAWARFACFYLNLNNEMDITGGSNKATGLIGICARENRPTTEWQCVYDDQMRRVKAIATVLEKYRRLIPQGKSKPN